MSGQAIYLGGAEPADFARLDAAGVDLAGKVVVAHSVFPFDLVALLTERGIAGFVHVCETPDGIVGNFTGALYPPPLTPPWEGRPLPYAGVTIGHLAARALISALTCGAPVELTIGHEGSCTQATTANVVGVIPGRGEEEVVLSAHYDSQAEGPCVYDNGSGLSSLLETARALRELQPERRVVLVASSAEEIGVWGATAYVDAHREELTRAVAMINLDGLASAYPAQREVWSIHGGLLSLAVQTGASSAGGPTTSITGAARSQTTRRSATPACRRAVLAARLPLLPLARGRARAGRRGGRRRDRERVGDAGGAAGPRARTCRPTRRRRPRADAEAEAEVSA